MKKTSRLLALLLALMIALAMFAGCNDNNTEPSQEAAATPAPAATEEPVITEESIYPLTTEDVTLSFFYQVDSTILSSGKDLTTNKVFEEMEALTGVKMEFMPTSNISYSEQFNILLNSGTMADIISDFLYGYTSSLDFAVDEEIILNLNDYTEYCPNYLAFLDGNESFSTDAHTDSGYLPVFYRLQDYQRIRMSMVIRQDWLDELNLETPETYDEVHDVLQAFQVAYGGGALHLYSDVSVVFSDGYNALFTQYQSYRPFYQVDGVVKYGFIEEDFRDYLTMLSTWYSEGLIYKDGLQNSFQALFGFNDDASSVLNNEVGIFRTYADMLGMFKSKSEDENFRLAGMATPVREKGQSVSVVVGHVSTGASVNASLPIVINGDCQYPEIAVRWMDWWYSEDGIRAAMYGAEGVTFNYNAAGEPEFTDFLLKNEDGLSMEQVAKLYSGYLMPSYANPAIFDAGLSEDALECYETWSSNRNNDYVIPTTVTLTADETDEMSRTMSDIDTYASENILAFVTGAQSMSEFDTFVEEIKRMGIEDCIALEQAAYNRYINR